MNDDTLIYFGGDVKALGGGRVGGYLVRFNKPDSQGDIFTAETYYGIHVPGKAELLYHHGLGEIFPKGRGNVDDLTAALGCTTIGVAEMKAVEDGIVVDATLDMDAHPRVAEVYARAERGELAWSSGSMTRATRRDRPDAMGRTVVRRWPIFEASLSHAAVDKTNRAYIKALIDADVKADPDAMAEADESGACPTCNGPAASMTCAAGHTYTPRTPAAKAAPGITETPGEAKADTAPSLVERTEALVAEAEVVVPLFAKAHAQRRAEGRSLSEPKRSALKALLGAMRSLHVATAGAEEATRRETLRRRLLLDRLRG